MERRFSRPRFGERDFGDRFEKPVKEGETYEVEINEVGSKGDGIARVKNFVVFVPDTKKGEKCKIKISQVSRRFAIGEKVGGATKAKKESLKEEVEEKKVGKATKAEKESLKEEVEEKIEEEPTEELEEGEIEDQ